MAVFVERLGRRVAALDGRPCLEACLVEGHLASFLVGLEQDFPNGFDLRAAFWRGGSVLVDLALAVHGDDLDALAFGATEIGPCRQLRHHLLVNLHKQLMVAFLQFVSPRIAW